MRAPGAGRALLAPLAVGLVAGALAGCAVPGAAGDERPVVVVSTNILGDVVAEVAGDEARVVTLMEPEADPHSFEISAQQAAEMRTADLVVSNGLGLEEGLQQHLDAAAAEGVPAFVAGDAIEVLDYAQGDAVGAPDPHFWADPARTADVVEGLEDALVDLDGVDRSEVRAGAADYLEELQRLDAEMTEAFSAVPEQQRALVTNHHVFGYLAERFDLRVVGAVIPGGTTLAAPSASDLSDLVDAVEQNGVDTVFAESSSPDRLAQALAAEADVEVEVVELFTESLTRPGGGAEDYLSMMRANTDRIVTGLD